MRSICTIIVRFSGTYFVIVNTVIQNPIDKIYNKQQRRNLIFTIKGDIDAYVEQN